MMNEQRMKSITAGHNTGRVLCAALLAAAIAAALVFFSGCAAKKAEYTIDAEGTVAESGVIEYAGLEMNVYADAASNPCGDCPDQPVSVYAGTSAEDVIAAMSQAVKRADDIWQVESCSGTRLVLVEKESGTVSSEPELSAPEGLTLTGKLSYTRHPAGSGENASADAESSAAAENTREVTNLDGTVISVPEEAQRIAAVYGPSYEAAVVLGAADRVVVRADVQSDDFPWALKIFGRLQDTPCLKNVHSSVSFEELQTYNPDLVLTFNRPNELKQLRNAGIAAVNSVTPADLSDTEKFLDVYAEAIGGDAPAKAQKYNTYCEAKLKYVTDITSQIADADKPTVYYAGIDILTTYGGKSDICDVIEAAGGKCVTADLDAGNHTQISFEQLASWDPEYIFIDHGGMNDKDTVEEIRDSVSRDSQYAAISAVRNDRMYLVPSGVFYWDMGLQKILLVMDMAKTLHPQQFASLDMNAEVRSFYSEFFGYNLSQDEAQRILDREDPR